MRGEYCVYGATVLSLISAIILVFANISQLSAGPVTNGLYYAELAVQGLGGAYDVAAGGGDGLYTGDAKAKMGMGSGLKQYYRYGVYGACGYIPAGGVCNSTMFGYPFDPLGNMMADITTDRGMRGALPGLIGADQPLVDANYNQVLSRAANFLVFIGSALCGIALIVGVFKTRLAFLAATIAASLSALFLLVASAIWTAIISRNSVIAKRMISNNRDIGIRVNAGPSLYLTWVAFAISTLSVAPYVISFITFRRQGKSYQ